MLEALDSSETSLLQEPHGVTSQKTPFFALQTSSGSCQRSLGCARLESAVFIGARNCVVIEETYVLCSRFVQGRRGSQGPLQRAATVLRV
jgi:hypothetical protein